MDRIIETAKRAAHGNEQERLQSYERFKKQIQNLILTPAEYAIAITKLAKALHV